MHNVAQLPNLRILSCGLVIQMSRLPPIAHTSSCAPCFSRFLSHRIIHNFVVACRLNNTNPTVLTAAEAIVAQVPNADCSHTITTQQANLTPATGYTLVFADPIDQTKECYTFFFVSLTGFLFHDRFMPFRHNSRLRPWARRIQLRLLRLRNLLPRPRLELVAPAQALVVPAVPPQAHPSQIVLLRHSRSLLLVCWLPSVLPLACSEPSDVYQNMFALGQRHYALPHVFCFNYS
jgi:hypothetical protein